MVAGCPGSYARTITAPGTHGTGPPLTASGGRAGRRSSAGARPTPPQRRRPHARMVPDIRPGAGSPYVFNPALGGRGYATEAANVMLRLGFEGLGLHRIVARIDERNESSVRLARRLGMRQEARLVRNEFFKGEWSTELDFAMLADEWYARQKE